MTDAQNDQLRQIASDVKYIRGWIEGTSQSDPGAKVRLDRLERTEAARQQSLARMAKAVWTVASAAIVALVTTLWQAMRQ